MGKVAFEITVDGVPSARQNLNVVRSCMQDLKKDVELLAYAYAGWQASMTGMSWLRDKTSEILDTGIAMQKLNAQFSTIGGSTRVAAGELGYVRAEAKRLGLDFMALTTQYANVLNTTRGTSLEGSPTQSMFSGMAEGLAALQKGSDDQQRIFAQLTQMMAKGKIELEDVKVIAETGIPIFNMLSAAIGKSNPEMMQMMSNGQLLSLEVLPKLGQSLHAQFGQKAVESGDLAQGAINKFKNELLDARAKFAEHFMPTFAGGLNLITNNIEVIRTAATGLAATLAANVATRIGVNTIAPAVSGQMPYLRNALNADSGAVALNSAAADKMRAAAALEAAKAEEIDAAQTLANAVAQERRLMALQSSGAMYQRLAVSEQERAAGLAMQAQAHAGLAVASKTTATAEAAHLAAQNAVTVATARYTVATDAAAFSTRALAVASKAFQGVLAFFGGPIGAIITGLSLAGMAWATYSAKQDQAQKKSLSTLEAMEEEVRLLRERNRLAEYKGPKVDKYTDAEITQLAYLKSQVEETREKAASSWYESDEEAYRNALARLQRFYDAKKNFVTEKEIETARLAMKQAEQDANNEKMRLEKLADDLRRLAEAKLKNQVEAVKNAGALELDALKDRYDQGLVATQSYYDKVQAIAGKGYRAELKLLTTQKASLEAELEKMLKQKKEGKDDEKTIAVRVKIEETSGAIDKLKSGHKGDIQKNAADLAKAVRDIAAASAEVEAVDLERQGRFVDAWKVRKAAYEKTPEYLRLERDALAGNRDAMSQYANKEREWSVSRAENSIKELQALQEAQNAVVVLKNERLQTLGISDTEFKLTTLGREEKQKIAILEAQLEAARLARNPVNIARYQAEIAAVQALYEVKRKVTNEELAQEAFKAKQSMLASELALAEAKGETQKANAIRQQISSSQALNEAESKMFELTNKRTALNDMLNRAINEGNSADQDRYTNQYYMLNAEIEWWQDLIRIRKEANQTAIDAANLARAGIAPADNYQTSVVKSSDPFGINALISNSPGIPFYATGTNYVPNDGLAYLHKGEAVIPKNINDIIGGVPKRAGDGSWWVGGQQVVLDEYGYFHNTSGYGRVVNNNLPTLSWDYNSKLTSQQLMAGKSSSEMLGASSYLQSLYSGVVKAVSKAMLPTGGVNIYVTVQGGATGQETARELAREIYPELQKLARRQAA